MYDSVFDFRLKFRKFWIFLCDFQRKKKGNSRIA